MGLLTWGTGSSYLRNWVFLSEALGLLTWGGWVFLRGTLDFLTCGARSSYLGHYILSGALDLLTWGATSSYTGHWVICAGHWILLRGALDLLILQQHGDGDEDEVQGEHAQAEDLVHAPLAGRDADNDGHEHDEEQDDGALQPFAVDHVGIPAVDGSVQDPGQGKPVE